MPNEKRSVKSRREPELKSDEVVAVRHYAIQGAVPERVTVKIGTRN